MTLEGYKDWLSNMAITASNSIHFDKISEESKQALIGRKNAFLEAWQKLNEVTE